jgi:hypothetical protein
MLDVTEAQRPSTGYAMLGYAVVECYAHLFYHSEGQRGVQYTIGPDVFPKFLGWNEGCGGLQDKLNKRCP